jgi:hypothetical protein
MQKFQLILMIESFIKSDYSAWSIGITDRSMEKEFELKPPKNWHAWEADSEDSAKEIKELFVQKGCKSVYGDNGHFVYIFLT